MSLDDRHGAGEEDEEDWEEEYVMLDLHDIFHGAPVPNFAYTLSGLDTLNPILTLDNGLKLIGHYVETIGTVVVYSEKEKEAQADRCELPPPADPNANNPEKRPLKRIRGVCKLERKLKFCAVPISYAPARNHTSTEDTSLGKTVGTADESLGNALQTQGAIPTENTSLNNTRPAENGSLGDARLEEDEPPADATSTEDALLRNDISMYSTSVEIANPVEDESLDSIRPASDAPLENAQPMEDAAPEHAKPDVDATLELARAVEDISREGAVPTEDTSK